MGLRLLHAIQTIDPATGGPIEGLRQLAAINSRFGHVIEVATMDAPDSPWLDKLGVKVHALGPGVTGYGFSRRFLEWMSAHLREYDCVIVNGVWGFNALGTWMAARRTNVPYVVFTHGMLDPWFKNRYPLKHFKKWLYWPWGLFPVLRDADAVLFTCDKERELARESFWLYDCNEVSVKYGTAGIPEPDRDYREGFLSKHPELRGKRLFLFFGRVHPKKGPDLFIRAVAELLRAGRWDETQMRLVMAGPADSQYAEKLKAHATRLGVADSIYWTGLVTGDERWGAFQSAEAFVLPSHQENFGIAVAEALSAGTPVLISHSVNISPEIAADGAGFVDDDTSDGCVRNLIRWLNLDHAGRDRMKKQARVTFEARYTAREAAKDLLKQIYLVLTVRKRAGKRGHESNSSARI
ncbi:MAG TPA: glycosyltransferase [Chthoniobacterales bacterium]